MLTKCFLAGAIIAVAMIAASQVAARFFPPIFIFG
jgi:hypothetical protein